MLKILLQVSISVPQTFESSKLNGTTDYIDVDTEDFLFSSIFNFINHYLWYLFGVVAFALLLYIGYLLLTAEGQEQNLKKANRTLIYGLVGLLIMILSYAVVKLIANLW